MKSLMIAVAIVFALTGSAMAQSVNMPILSPGANQSQAQDQTQQQQSVNQQGQFDLSQHNLSVTSTGVPNLIQLPGVIGAYQNFSQPYKPETMISGASPAMPAEMTFAQAEACKGDAKSSDKRKIKLYYYALVKVAVQPDFSLFTGETWVEEKNKPYTTVLCKAAVKAMENGAEVGYVQSVAKARNEAGGWMLGAAVGGSGMPGAGLNPYQLSGTFAAGFGKSGAEVVDKLVVIITGYKSGVVTRTSDGRMLDVPNVKVSIDTPAASPSAMRQGIVEAGSAFTPATQGN